MILVLETRSAVQSLYLRALGELLEDCLVAPSIGALQQLLREQPRVDLVIAELELDGVVISEVVEQLRPEAGFLAATDMNQFGMTGDEFVTRCKLGVKITLTNRLVHAVMARVCHEVNNPATAILGTAELAKEAHGDELPEPVRKSLATIMAQSLRIGRVTHALAGLNPQEMEIIFEGATPMISFTYSNPEQ